MASDLITYTEYKTYAGISSDKQDSVIKAIIPKASALVKSICRRTFVDYVNDTKVEVFSSGVDRYYVEEFPLLTVSSLEYSSDYGNTYTTLTEYTDYIVKPTEGLVHLLNWESYPEQLNAFRITYTGGYETLPDDLKVATMDLVTYYIKSDMAVKSQRDAGSNTVQIEYITKNTLPSHIQRVLEIYVANAS